METSKNIIIYPLKITVLDEICLSMRLDAGNHYETITYIPGRLLWGAFASITPLSLGQIPSDDFMSIFYSDDVVFSNCYPSDDVNSPEYGSRSNIIPLSARTLKTAPGFKDDDIDPKPKGVFDWLFKMPEDIEPEDYIRVEGFYSKSMKCSVSVGVSLSVHHERHRQRGTPKEGALYSRTNIKPETVFWGYIKLPTEKESTLLNLFPQLASNIGITTRLGRKPGSVRINKTEDISKVVSNLDIFTYDDNHFTITTYSDVILLDEYQRYMSHIPGELLESLMPSILQSCRLKRYFSSTSPYYGWNGAYCRPLETDIAISKGSAFLYEYQLRDGATKDDLINALKTLQDRGIGIRRNEGFGEIGINDSFHRDFPCQLKGDR